jgi:hypothetical protein
MQTGMILQKSAWATPQSVASYLLRFPRVYVRAILTVGHGNRRLRLAREELVGRPGDEQLAWRLVIDLLQRVDRALGGSAQSQLVLVDDLRGVRDLATQTKRGSHGLCGSTYTPLSKIGKECPQDKRRVHRRYLLNGTMASALKRVSLKCQYVASVGDRTNCSFQSRVGLSGRMQSCNCKEPGGLIVIREIVRTSPNASNCVRKKWHLGRINTKIVTDGCNLGRSGR